MTARRARTRHDGAGHGQAARPQVAGAPLAALKWSRGTAPGFLTHRVDHDLLDALPALSGIEAETHAPLARKATERRHPEAVAALTDYGDALRELGTYGTKIEPDAGYGGDGGPAPEAAA